MQTAIVDPSGYRREMRYGTDGKLEQMTLPGGGTNLVAYDADGRQVAFTDSAGRSGRFEYDAAGRPKALIPPDDTSDDDADNPRAVMEYDRVGRLTAVVGERDARTEFEYDAAGRPTLVRDALGNETRTVYDADGKMVAKTDSLGRTMRFFYDAAGRLVRTVLPDGNELSSRFDALGNEISTTNRAGRTTQYEYDALGQLHAVVDPLGQRTEYTYDELGHLVSQVDANGHVTHYEYDGLGRRTVVVLPLGQRSETVYDVAGRVIRFTDFNGNQTTYEYDIQGLLSARRYSDGSSVLYTYAPGREVESVTDARGTTQFTYDARDRLLSRTEPDGTTIAYSYDAAGNVTTVITPAGTTQYAYDLLNRLATVTDPEGGVTRYTYDAVGNLILTEQPNGTSESRGYDLLDQLLSVMHLDGSGTVLASYSYTLDAAGNRITVLEQDGRRVDYTYDMLDRLVREYIVDPGMGNRSIDYTFDAVGNRLTRNDSSEGLTGYTYDANDRVLTQTIEGEVTRYSYDNNGNVLFREAVDRVFYEWDLENRLVAIDTDGDGRDDVQYRYDSEGNRVAQVVNGVETRFLIDAHGRLSQVALEYTTGGIIKDSYVYGRELISQSRDGERSFYVQDGHSGVRMMTNSFGNITDEYDYDAFGRLLRSSGGTVNPYLYRGEAYDTLTKLQYLRARYYLPELGRFASVDPFEGLIRVPMSRNRFLYGSANPVSRFDPSGMADFDLKAVLARVALYGVLLTVGQQSIAAVGRYHSEIRWEGYLAEVSIELGGTDANLLLMPLSTTDKYGEAYYGTWLLVMYGVEQNPGDVLNFLGSGGGFLSAFVQPLDKLHVSFGSQTMLSPTFIGVNPAAFLGGAILMEVSAVVGKGPAATWLLAGFGHSDFSAPLQVNYGIDVSAELVAGLSIPMFWVSGSSWAAISRLARSDGAR